MEHINNDAMMQTQYRIDALSCGMALRYIHVFHRDLFDKIGSCKIPLAVSWMAGAYIISIYNAQSDFMHSVGLTIVYLTAASFILFCYDMPAPISRSIFVRGMAYVGLFSYAIYVLQYAAVKPSVVLANHLHLTGTSDAVFRIALSYAGAFVAGVIVTILVERPMLNLRNFLFPQYGLHARQRDLFREVEPIPVIADRHRTPVENAG
ncbi:hypothetical protein WBP06_23835 [Novosphingobium sp. BL-8H]|uniref:acyltransferase family protein n=1 Tax=Novosphingobium sp. BL-8H TaxID=3127640 RepID=UPI003756B0B4